VGHVPTVALPEMLILKLILICEASTEGEGVKPPIQVQLKQNQDVADMGWCSVFFMFARTMCTTSSAGRELVPSPFCGGPAMHFQS